MSRKLGFLWVIVVFILSFSLLLAASAAEDAKTASIDAVILLDTSWSMRTSDKDTSLVKGAIEAAQMMIQLCEVGSSRVAVIPFNSTLETDPDMLWNKLLPVNTQGVRDRFARDISKLRPKYDTHVGLALETAYNLLENRYDGIHDGNNPMILLLSDGEPFISMRDSIQRDEKATAATKDLALSIAQKCYGKYPIYSIALLGRDHNKNYAGENLEQYAAESGGLMRKTSSPTELPGIFNDFLAHHIGSEILEVPHEVDEEGNVTLTVNIPNRSVLEANVIIGIDTTHRSFSAPKIMDPTPSIQTGLSEHVWLYSIDDYHMIKLVNPDVGPWTITYKPNSDQSVSASLLTSYTLQYMMEDVPTEVNKNDSIVFTTRFWDGDSPSGDDSLYKGGIEAVVRLKDERRMLLLEERMNTSGDGLSFEARLDMKYPSGLYYISTSASGDGLFRECDAVSFTIVNNAPVSKKAFEPVHLEIDRILEENPYSSQEYVIERLTDYFTEPDGENMDFTVKSKAPNVAVAEVIGDTLIIRTAEQAGETEITVTAADVPEGLSHSMSIQVVVVSIETDLADRYTLSLMSEGGESQPKDSDVILRAVLARAGGEKMTAQDIEWVQGILCNAVVSTTIKINDIPVAKEALPTFCYTDTPLGLAAEIRTGKMTEKYDVSIGACLHSLDYTAETFFSVGNTPPYIREDAPEVPEEMWLAPILPGQELFEVQRIDLYTIFADREDQTLDYELGEKSWSNFQKPCLELSLQEGWLNIQAIDVGSVLFTVIAKDGDGQTVHKTIGISVRSHTFESLKRAGEYLFYIIVASIAIFLLWKILFKPAIPPGRKLIILLEGNPYDTIALRKGRSNRTLNTMYPQNLQSMTPSVRSVLRSIILIPAMNDRLKIKHKKRKGQHNGDVCLEVNGKMIAAKKSGYVSLNQMITLHFISEDGVTKKSIAWRYT